MGLFLADDYPLPVVPAGTYVTSYGDRDLLAATGEDDGDEVMAYAMSIPGRDDWIRWGPVHPVGRVGEGLMVGQMMNDGAVIHVPALEDLGAGEYVGYSGLEAAIEEYQKQTLARVNVGPPGGPGRGDWAMHLDRDVDRGSELFITYGPMYWLNRLMFDPASTPLTRLLTYVYTVEHHADMHPVGHLYLAADGQLRTVIERREEPLKERDCSLFMVHRLNVTGELGDRALRRALGEEVEGSYEGRCLDVLARMIRAVTEEGPKIGREQQQAQAMQ